MSTLAHLSALVLQHLVWASLQALLLTATIAVLLRLRPNLPAAVRSVLWWLVGLQVLLGLGASVPVRVPLSMFPVVAVRAPATAAVTPAAHVLVTTNGATTKAHAATPADADTPAPVAKALTAGDLATALASLWLLGVLVQLAMLALDTRRTRALCRDVRTGASPVQQAALERLTGRMGLRQLPRLCVSEAIDSPQVLGARHPVVLMPAHLNGTEWHLALAHELAHLRRGDLWLAWVPTLARLLFFFHPAVRHATREYGLHREAACDALALQHTGLPPHAYAQLLLRLGVQRTPQAGLAGASPTFRTLHRRLTMLQQNLHTPAPRLRAWLWLAAIAAIGVMPYRLVAAPDAPSSAAGPAASAHPASIAVQDAQALPAPPPPPPAPPAMPPAPPAPPPPPVDLGARTIRHMDIDTHSGARIGVGLFTDGTLTVQGGDGDLQAVARQVRASGKPLLWYRKGDKTYVSHDPALIRAARKAYAPVIALARQRGHLAGHEGELAGRQGDLAAQEGALAARRAALAQVRAEIAGQRAHLASLDLSARDTKAKARQAERRALVRQEAEMQRRETQLKKDEADRHIALARQRKALEAQRAQIEAQRKQLVQREAAVREQARKTLRSLLDNAIRTGRAQPVTAD